MLQNLTMFETTIEGDGTTDHTATLQALINERAEIRLGEGVYCFTALTIPADRVLIGEGNKTILKQVGAGVGLTIGGDNVTIERLRIESAHTSTTHALFAENRKFLTLRNVSLYGYTPGVGQDWSDGVLKFVSSGGDNVYALAIENCHIQGANGHGVVFVGGCGASHIYGGRIQWNNGYGVYAAGNGGLSLSLRDVILEGNAQGAMYADCWYGGEATGCHMENSTGQTTPLMRLGINGACKGVSIRGCTLAGVAADYLIDLSGGGANTGVVIEGNRFAMATLAAIKAAKLWNARISNNEIALDAFPLIEYAPAPFSQCRNLLIQHGDTFKLVSTGECPVPEFFVGRLL